MSDQTLLLKLTPRVPDFAISFPETAPTAARAIVVLGAYITCHNTPTEGVKDEVEGAREEASVVTWSLYSVRLATVSNTVREEESVILHVQALV